MKVEKKLDCNVDNTRENGRTCQYKKNASRWLSLLNSGEERGMKRQFNVKFKPELCWSAIVCTVFLSIALQAGE